MEMMILLARMYRRTGEKQFLQQFWQTAETTVSCLSIKIIWYGTAAWKLPQENTSRREAGHGKADYM